MELKVTLLAILNNLRPSEGIHYMELKGHEGEASRPAPRRE